MIIDNIKFIDKNGNKLVKSFDIKQIEIDKYSAKNRLLLVITLISDETNLFGIISDTEIRNYTKKLISKKFILNYILFMSFCINDDYHCDFSIVENRQIISL